MLLFFWGVANAVNRKYEQSVYNTVKGIKRHWQQHIVPCEYLAVLHIATQVNTVGTGVSQQ